MLRSRFVFAWYARVKPREDRALSRLDRLEAIRQTPTKAPVPVFFARKASLA
ncbi:MAG: hypothetical protein ACK47C_05580 [Paracoccaceae bacterium]|jgi:hypothetical protein